MSGTTVDDSDEKPLHALIDAFGDFGISVSEEEGRIVMGKNKRDSVKELLEMKKGESPKEKVDKIYARFQFHLEKRLSNVKPIAGAEKVFRFLKKNRIWVAITTGYYRKAELIILQNLNWLKKGLIDEHVCSDDLGEGRPAPDMILEIMKRCDVNDENKVVKIGDTVADIQAARNANVIALGVLTGTHSEEKLRQAGADDIISSVAKLPQHLKERGYITKHACMAQTLLYLTKHRPVIKKGRKKSFTHL